MEFSVPEEKLNILLQFISQLLERGTANAKDLAKVTGHIISMSPAIGPLTRLMTRQAYKFIESSGYGGYIIEKQQKFIACGKFTFDETKQSSTYR